MTQWQMIFSEFNIIFIMQKAIKGQAIADHLAENLREDDYQPLHTYFPDEKILFIGIAEDMNERYSEWRLFFDGVSNSFGAGIGAIIVSPEGKRYPDSVKLRFLCTNNMAEYEICIFGLKMALEIEIKDLIVFSDFDLLMHQTLKEWITRDSKILSYHCNLLDLAKKFRSLEFRHIPRARNVFADALATLSSMIQHPDELVIEPIQIQLQEKPTHCLVMKKSSDGRPWYSNIKEFLKTGSYPPGADATAKNFLCRLSSKFFLNGDVVYKRTSDLGLLRCVDEEEADYLMKEVHSGILSENALNVNCMGMLCALPPQNYTHVTKNVVTDFLRKHIICRFGMPETLITDNAKNFNNDMVDRLCEQFKINYQNSTIYRSQMNGTMKAANKNSKKIIRKMIERHRDWHKKLPYILMAYRTAIQTSIRAMPYNLMYGIEADLPAEVEISSLRILMEAKLNEANWIK
ncbi:uncharacterized protein [Coffea arabica]|uniref:Integrase catalytic domain-containing protein n=1 Tax=Coffea arabica TaxID=13443 RepID=A0ABM4VQP5_COFAR